MAITLEGKYVSIQQAVRGKEYFCLNCKERLFPSFGDKNIHHFRHFNKKDRAALKECELYSSGDSSYEVLYNEQSYENFVRFTIDQAFEFKIILPYLEEEQFSKMNLDNLYFNVQIEDKKIFSSDLGRKSKIRYFNVPLEQEYQVCIDEKKNAEQLKYNIGDKYSLIQKKVLLFKKMKGEFINIPYQKTNLSDEFYLISKNRLDWSDELILINKKIINGIYVYHFYLEELTDSLVGWFKRETDYIVVHNRKWIDLFYPVRFQYSYDAILIDTEQIQLKITDSMRTDVLTILDHTREKILKQSPDKNGNLKYDLKLNNIYTFQLNNELSNELTIKRVQKIHQCSSYMPLVQINKQPYDFKVINMFNSIYTTESDLYFKVFMKYCYPYQTKEVSDVLPNIIHFPYLGTIYEAEKVNKSFCGLLELKTFINQNKYIVVKNSEFRMVFDFIKNSKSPNKLMIMNILSEKYNNLPKQIVKQLRKGVYDDYFREKL